ncbi:hypothetical protein [Guptibacillus algicola]|uniref:hypothetical protein n=1 Tax=Guptibacillus algicola TaxID=225844 RepID=UPI001CD4715E|nr:hypothetical protein [Alkalihalobacillus algicola]MCA0988443.1 hypothetical protein [Alkalihalobacillus algicola]
MSKNTSLLLAIGLAAGTLLAGCGNNSAEEDTQNNSSEESTMNDDAVTEDSSGGGGAGDSNTAGEGSEMDLETGVDQVMTDLDSLSKVLDESPDDVTKMNELGNQIDSHWELFEEKLEKEYPDEYKNIEEDLYPLIDEAKKDEPDVEKVRELLDATKTKLTSFKDTMKME